MTHKEKAERRANIAKMAARKGIGPAAKHFGVGVGTVYQSCIEHGVRPAKVTKEKVR